MTWVPILYTELHYDLGAHTVYMYAELHDFLGKFKVCSIDRVTAAPYRIPAARQLIDCVTQPGLPRFRGMRTQSVQSQLQRYVNP